MGLVFDGVFVAAGVVNRGLIRVSSNVPVFRDNADSAGAEVTVLLGLRDKTDTERLVSARCKPSPCLRQDLRDGEQECIEEQGGGDTSMG